MVADLCGDEEAHLCLCSICEKKFELAGMSQIRRAWHSEKAGMRQNKTYSSVCKKCNNEKLRLTVQVRSCLTEEQAVGYHNMSKQGLKELYKKTQQLHGHQLKKELTEAILLSDIERATMANEEGLFQPRDEVVADWSLKRPEMLKVLLEKAPTRKCQHTERVMIMVPSYSVKRSKEQQNQLELDSLQTAVKKIKVQKEITDEPDDEKKENQEGEPSDKPAMGKPDNKVRRYPRWFIKPASEAQLMRLTGLVVKLELEKLKHAHASFQIEAHHSVPDKLMAKIDAYKCKLDITKGTAEKFLKEKQFSCQSFEALLVDSRALCVPRRACLAQIATITHLLLSAEKI